MRRWLVVTMGPGPNKKNQRGGVGREDESGDRKKVSRLAKRAEPEQKLSRMEHDVHAGRLGTSPRDGLGDSTEGRSVGS